MTVRRRRPGPAKSVTKTETGYRANEEIKFGDPIRLDAVIEPATTGPKPEQSLPTKRRRRANVGEAALKLTAPSREGEKRRWVNDDGNRIAQVRELGYEFVSETGIKTSDPGSHVSRLVGTKANGEPLHAHLMETPDELYAQGIAEKEAVCQQIDEAITAGRDSTDRLENQYGHGSIKVER